MRKGAWAYVHEHGDSSHSDLVRRLPDNALATMIRQLAEKFDADVRYVYDADTNRDVPVNTELCTLLSAALLEYWTRHRDGVPQVIADRALARLPDVRDTWPDRQRAPRYDNTIDLSRCAKPPTVADVMAELPELLRRGRLNGWNNDWWDNA